MVLNLFCYHRDLKYDFLKQPLFKNIFYTVTIISFQDVNQNGFHKWPFLSVQTWGEDPRGTWTLVVESVTNVPSVSGKFVYLLFL